MQILYVGDVHISGKNYSIRLDDSLEAVFAKLEEIKLYAKKSKAELTVFGGDVFHSPLVSNVISDRLIDYFNDYPHPCYSIYGNHDCYNASTSLSESSSLAHVFRRSKLKHLTNLEFDDIIIEGQDYCFNIEKPLNECGGMIDSNKFKILVPHAMFVDSEVAFMTCIPMSKFMTNADMVFVSHNHAQYGIKKIGNTTFVCPGALSRGSVSQDDLDRKPAVAVIDTKANTAKLHYLKCAKPTSEIFDLQKIAEQKQDSAKIQSFLRNLESVQINNLNFLDSLNDMFNLYNVPEYVKADILRRL